MPDSNAESGLHPDSKNVIRFKTLNSIRHFSIEIPMPDSNTESGLHLYFPPPDVGFALDNATYRYELANYVMIGGVLVKKHDKDRRLSEKNEISLS